MSAPADDLLEALDFAGELVTRCGHQAAARQRGVVEHAKPGGSLAGTAVTDVDLDLERAVDEAVAQRYPADGLLGEEGTDRAGTSGRTWVVDPVDGTLNYARRAGPWSVVLCAWDGDDPLLAAVWSDGVLYTAAAGRGARMDGAVLALGDGPAEAGGIVRVPAALAAATDAAGWLARTVESSAAELVAVADGRSTGAVRLRGDRRDLHGPALIAQEAGARVTDLDGGPWTGASPGLVLGHPGAHADLLALARGARGGPTPKD
jgi:myo-inositol-1(or 4)-monophosphatase